MIDWVGIRVPADTRPGPALAPVFDLLRREPVPPFRPSKFYLWKADLRECFGIDAVLWLFCKFGKPHHKIEIIDAGKKTLWQMAEIVAELFDVDPWALELMRVDFAADIEGTPVSWFGNNASVDRKQFSSRIDKSRDMEVEFVHMGTAVAQTIYAGKRPNLYRIYNKLAEWHRQWRRLTWETARFNAKMESLDMDSEQLYYGSRFAPDFRGFCAAEGYDFREGSILTRIEHQTGGGRLPCDLVQFGDLCHAHELNPFTHLRLGGTEPVPGLDSPPEGVSVRDWLAWKGLMRLKEERGAQTALSLVLRHSKGNGKRILASLESASPGFRSPLTNEEVLESYRKSTLLQTSQTSGIGIYSSPTYGKAQSVTGSRT